MLDQKQGERLIQIVSDNIKSVLLTGNKIDINSDEKWLMENKATFVTLTISGNLRGCIGSLEAYRSLYTDIIENSFNAAFRDPRFPPLDENEFNNTDIEVSVLTPKKELIYNDIDDLKSKLFIGEDGVYLTHKGHGATFLPQVWEQLPNFKSFFSHLLLKAGLPEEILYHGHPKIETYKVQKFR